MTSPVPNTKPTSPSVMLAIVLCLEELGSRSACALREFAKPPTEPVSIFAPDSR